MEGSLRRLIGAGGMYTLATVAPILALLVVTPFVTRILGGQEYGQVAIAVSVYQFGSVLLALGLPVVVTRNAIVGASGFPGGSGLAFAGSLLAVVGCILAAGTAFLWAPLAFPGVSAAVVSLALIAGAGLAVVTLVQALFRAAELVVRFVVIGASAAILPPVVGVALLLLVARSAVAYSAGLAIGYAVVGVTALFSAYRLARPHIARTEILSALRIGAPTVPHSLTVPLLLTFALSIVTRFDGLDAAGELQVAAMLGTSVITIMNAVNNAWGPLIFKASDADRPRVLSDSSFVVALVALMLMCGYSIVGPLAITIVGGPVVTGDATARASMLIASAGVFHVLYLANIHLTFLSGRTAPLAILTPLSAVAALAALALVARQEPALTLWAFAVTWPLFYLLQALFSYLLARRGPYPPADLRWASGPLVLAALVALQAAFLGGQPAASVIASGFALTAGVALVWAHRRSGAERLP